MPNDAQVYDCLWDKSKKEWVKWTDTVAEYFVDSRQPYEAIVVPTFDSIRM